jgi:hypothetical protein
MTRQKSLRSLDCGVESKSSTSSFQPPGTVRFTHEGKVHVARIQPMQVDCDGGNSSAWQEAGRTRLLHFSQSEPLAAQQDGLTFV